MLLILLKMVYKRLWVLNMGNIKITVDAFGYVTNFARLGELTDSIEVVGVDFDADNYDCYKLVDGKLIFDDAKYQDKINPVPIDPQPSDMDILKEQVATQQAIIDELLFDILPSLITDEEVV